MQRSNPCIHSPLVRWYLKPQFLHDYATEHLKIYAWASSNYALNTCKIVLAGCAQKISWRLHHRYLIFYRAKKEACKVHAGIMSQLSTFFEWVAINASNFAHNIINV